MLPWIAAALCLFAPLELQAQTYPSQPVKLVVPFGPGSASDVYARIIADNVRDILGQTVIVDNKPGGNAVLAAETVARAKPDGYTLMFSSGTAHGANVWLVKNLSYDPVKDFEPITRLGTVNFFVGVLSSSPYRSLNDMVEDAKRKPGQLTIGSGSGSGIIISESLRKFTGADITHVPYRSSPQAMQDLLGGRVTSMVADFAAQAAYLRSGEIRALASAGPSRSTLYPDVPTMEEAGLKGFNLIGWFGLYAPAGTPKPIIDTLNKKFGEVVTRADLKPRFDELGYEPFKSTPEELLEHTKAEIQRWGKYTKDAGLEAQ